MKTNKMCILDVLSHRYGSLCAIYCFFYLTVILIFAIFKLDLNLNLYALFLTSSTTY